MATKEQMAAERMAEIKRRCGVPEEKVEDSDEFKQADDKGKAKLIMRSVLTKPMRIGLGR